MCFWVSSVLSPWIHKLVFHTVFTCNTILSTLSLGKPVAGCALKSLASSGWAPPIHSKRCELRLLRAHFKKSNKIAGKHWPEVSFSRTHVCGGWRGGSLPTVSVSEGRGPQTKLTLTSHPGEVWIWLRDCTSVKKAGRWSRMIPSTDLRSP